MAERIEKLGKQLGEVLAVQERLLTQVAGYRLMCACYHSIHAIA